MASWWGFEARKSQKKDLSLNVSVWNRFSSSSKFCNYDKANANRERRWKYFWSNTTYCSQNWFDDTKNLTYTFVQKTFEAHFINIRHPNLNKQVFRYNHTRICSCSAKKSETAIIGPVTCGLIRFSWNLEIKEFLEHSPYITSAAVLVYSLENFSMKDERCHEK